MPDTWVAGTFVLRRNVRIPAYFLEIVVRHGCLTYGLLMLSSERPRSWREDKPVQQSSEDPRGDDESVRTKRVRRRVAVASGALVVACAVALIVSIWPRTKPHATYTDPRGFSFAFPEDWVALAGDDPDAAIARIAHDPKMTAIKDWIAKHKREFCLANVHLFHPSDSESHESVTVVARVRETPIHDDAAEEVTALIKQEVARKKMKFTNINVRVQQVGSRKVLVVDLQNEMPGVQFPVRQRQCTLSGGGDTYLITFTAKADSFDHCAPVFDSILASFTPRSSTTSQTLSPK
jgi:hypothetical protein